MHPAVGGRGCAVKIAGPLAATEPTERCPWATATRRGCAAVAPLVMAGSPDLEGSPAWHRLGRPCGHVRSARTSYNHIVVLSAWCRPRANVGWAMHTRRAVESGPAHGDVEKSGPAGLSFGGLVVLPCQEVVGGDDELGPVGLLVLAGLRPLAWAAMVAGVLGKALFQAVER